MEKCKSEKLQKNKKMGKIAGTTEMCLHLFMLHSQIDST